MVTLDYKPSDIMVTTISHLLEDNKTAFHGVASHLPMVAMMLAKSMHAPNLTHLNIAGGVNPSNLNAASYSSAHPSFLKSATAYFSLNEIFDLSMRGKLDFAFLSGIQFDVHGNINASIIGDFKKPKLRLPGGAGSAVLIPTAKKCIIWRAKHDKRTFVENVDFVTTRGNVWKIVTPLCVFAFKNGRLHLDTIHPHSSLEEVRENTGFELLYDAIKYTEVPTKTELMKLNQIDPKGYRNMEFGAL